MHLRAIDHDHVLVPLLTVGSYLRASHAAARRVYPQLKSPKRACGPAAYSDDDTFVHMNACSPDPYQAPISRYYIMLSVPHRAGAI